MFSGVTEEVGNAAQTCQLACELFLKRNFLLNSKNGWKRAVKDIRDRKPFPLLISSTVGKREKWEENNIVATAYYL